MVKFWLARRATYFTFQQALCKLNWPLGQKATNLPLPMQRVKNNCTTILYSLSEKTCEGRHNSPIWLQPPACFHFTFHRYKGQQVVAGAPCKKLLFSAILIRNTSPRSHRTYQAYRGVTYAHLLTYLRFMKYGWDGLNNVTPWNMELKFVKKGGNG